jgi:hypothetical protein
MASNRISIPGVLQNSLCTGVSITDALSELFDNSISAGSTEIHMKLSGNTLNLSDNGHGMDRDKLEKSTEIADRTTSSSERHGCFGVGKKQAEMTLTDLKGSVTTFSSDGNRISQLTTDYPMILQTGVYYPHASGLQVDSRDIWEENARNPSGPGTLTSICLHEDVQHELSVLINDADVTGLRVMLATTYRDALEKGVKITIEHGDNNYQVYPIDRLCLSKRDTPLPPNYLFKCNSYDIDILQKKGELASYYMKTPDGGCKQFDRSKKTKGWIDKAAPGSFDLDKIGSVTYELAYTPNWNPLQQDAWKKNGITTLSDGQTGVEAQRAKTDGKELVRNGKVINHSEYKWKNVTNAHKHIHKKIRERISFKANPKIDKVFDVQVNKSSVNEKKIDPNLLKALEQLKTSFMSECDAIETANSVNESSVDQVKSSSASSPLTSPISSSPPSSDQMVPSKINTKTKTKLKIASKEPQTHLSDSHSEGDSDHERPSAGGGAICGGGHAVGGGNSHSTEISKFAPDSECDIGSSKRQFIHRNTGERILHEWKNSGKYPEIFNETLDKMHIEFSGKIAADTLKRYLNRIPMNEKYDLLLEMIREKYASPETPMKMGIELQRIYNKTFEADIAAGISPM